MNYAGRTVWQRLKYLINFPRSVKLIWNLMRDQRVARINKIMFFVIIVGFMLLPPNLMIPVIGEIDDLGIILFMMDQFIRRAPADVVAEYQPN